MEEKTRKTPFFVIRIIIYIAVILALAAGGWYFWKNFNRIEVEKSFTRAQTTITQCAELSVYKMNYTDILMLKKTTFGGLAKSYSIIKYSGVLRAGIEDLTAIKLELQPESKTIKVTVPPCVILGNDISKQEVFDEHQNVFVRIAMQDMMDMIEDAKKEAAEEIINDGLLDDADKRAREIITGLLNAAGFTDIIFE
ncbi:MAG: DUF4230 domain-containing protein [Treponema sp.]|nr:DUF4230 domain-containing protein [Treponema sp.]